MKFKFLIITGLVLMVFTSCENQKIAKAAELTVSEGFKNPIGFYDALPTFSWKLPVSETIKSQSAYQIVVATSEDILSNNADLWDSKKQESSESTFIQYEGKPLSSRQKVYWQVRYWDQGGKEAALSTVNSLELGLLNNADWKAKWTGLNTAKDNIRGVRKFLMHRPQYLRKDFELKSDITSARLYITAKGIFDVHLNGENVSDDVMPPGWTPYNKRIETITYDVTSLLESGQNALAVELASGWHSGRISKRKAMYDNFASPKILCQLEIELQDGSKKIIISDETWKGTTKGPIRLSGIYDGETYDANFELPNWTTNNFNDTAWEAVEVEDLNPKIKLEPKRHHTVKHKLTVPVSEIVEKSNASAIFNFGQNMVGVPKVNVPMKKGDTLTIRCSEMLEPDGSFYTENYRSAKSIDYYIAAKDGVVEWSPKFTFHGFQYIELSGFDTSKEPSENWVTGLVQYSDFEEQGTFTSSHKKLNQLQRNIVWGLRSNFFDVPTDCPQRDERLGWTGDAQVITPTALFNYDTHAFWTAWLQSMRETQSEHKNGLIPWIIPDILQNHKASPGWGDVCVILPWDIYNITGDIKVLEENYEMMLKWIDYHKSEAENNISNMAAFGDWLQPYPNKTGKSSKNGDTPKKLINTAYFAHSSNLVSKIAGVLGKIDDQKEYQKLYNEVSIAFENEFFNEDGSIKNNKGTQTGYLLAIHFELLKPETTKKAQQFLLKEIAKTNNHLNTGFLGTPILPKVLDKMGRTDLMYEILFKETYPSWFYSINQGATTTWERWNSYSKKDGFNPESMNSLNHYAYGAIGQWMYERIAGISSLEPGYKKIKIAPIPNQPLTSASAEVNTVYGKVSSSWKIENDTFYLDVVIPPNTSAEIHFPNSIEKVILLNGKSLEEYLNLKLTVLKDKIFIASLNAGTYKFQTKLKSDEL